MAFFPENTDDWRRVASAIEIAENIYITTHVNPDGDAIGSEMALARFLSKKNKYYRVINHSPTPDTFLFLDPDSCIEVFSEDMEFTVTPGQSDCIIFLDLGRYERCGRCVEFFENTTATKIAIDHHPPEQFDIDIPIINTRAASTGSLVYDLLCFMDDGSIIDYDVAVAILTAVVTDTGYFRYGNTTATTHAIAASLYTHGVSSLDIRRRLETGYPFCRQKLMGLVLGRLETSFGGAIAFSSITREMFEDAGAKREHTEGIIDQLRMINETQIVFLVIQEGDERFKVSFRSSDGISVNRVAAMLGGGGHPRAAGANLIGPLDTVTRHVLDAAETYLREKNGNSE